jgi:2'-5' RNA ligase
LWPDERVRAALATLVREFGAACGGRGVRPANLHVTLAFLGDVPVPRIASTIGALDGIRAEPFVLELDSCGYWRHNRIVWAGAAQCPLPLRRLVDALAVALQPHGFQREERSYTPHVTLLRDARRAPKTGLAQSIEWLIEAFVLVQSVRRERMPGYDILKRWPLRYAAGER